MKKYKLIKDLPFNKAGEVFGIVDDGKIHFGGSGCVYYLYPETCPEWFEEVDGRWKPELEEKIIDIICKTELERFSYSNRQAAKDIIKLLLDIT